MKAVCLASLLWLAVPAQATEQLLSPAEIRAHYQENVSGSPAPPRILLLAIAATDPGDFFGSPPQFSAAAFQLARQQASQGQLQTGALTFMIGTSLTHEEVLTWYASTAYFGRGCYGVADATRAYFGKDVSELSLEDAAYLAILAVSPLRYQPRHYDRALEQRNRVLLRMVDLGLIGGSEASVATLTGLSASGELGQC